MATKAEHSILFDGESVRGTLAGIKHQTRRIIKGLSPHWVEGKRPDSYSLRDWAFFDPGDPIGTYPTLFVCPYGVPGDTLVVRETTWKPPPDDSHIGVQYDADLTEADRRNAERDLLSTGWKRKPSIHMPRVAARLLPVITNIRIQQIQDISDADVRAEGITENMIAHWAQWLDPRDAPGHAFGKRWDGINAARGYPWSANNWVWTIDYEVQK